MLLTYFIVGLTPLTIKEKPSLSSREFLQKAHDCLKEDIVNDLQDLAKVSILDEAIRQWAHAQARGQIVDMASTPIFQMLQNYHHQIHLKPLVSVEPQVLRRLLWEMLFKTTRSNFIKKFSREMAGFYDALSVKIAADKNLPERNSLDYFDDFADVDRRHFAEKVEQALLKNDPLALEHFVAEQIFLLADECKHPDDLHPDSILAYFIKLTVCERFSSFDEDKGFIILQNFIKNVSARGLNEHAE